MEENNDIGLRLIIRWKMSGFFGSGNKRPKNEEPDPYFKSDLNILDNDKKCASCNCQKCVKIVISGCKHTMCGKCLFKSTRTFENGHTIFVCPICQRLEHSSWLDGDTLINVFETINYCTTCFGEEAVCKVKCRHLLCNRCLEHIEQNRKMTCQVHGCMQLFSINEIQDALNNASEILTWRYLEIARQESCDTLRCKNKAIFRFKRCRHSHCLTCAQQAQKASQQNDVQCLNRSCKTEVQGSVIQNFLREFRKTPLMTAVTLEFSKYSCRRCKDYCSKTVQIRNRSCSYSHAYCIPCMSFLKSCAQAEESPYFKSDCIQDQIKCPLVICTSQTSVKCLDAMIDTINGETFESGIFLRKADFIKKCENCRGKEAFIEFVACSHALCEDCVNKKVQDSAEECYRECTIKSCGNLIPMRVLLQFSKSRIQDKNAEIKDASAQEIHVVPEVSLTCTVDTKGQCILLNAVVESCSGVKVLKWMKDGKEIYIHTNKSKFIENRKHASQPSLKICKIGKNDEGLYKLIAENDHGQGMSTGVPFHIPEDPPKISISLHYNCEIKKCTVSAEVETNWPVLSAKWQKDQHNISISGNVSEYVDKEKDYLLFIRYCQRKDEGLYRMVAETVAGRSYSKEINFEIEELPTVTVEKNLKKTEECLQLVANIFSKKNPSFVLWLKDGKDVTFDHDKRILKKDLDQKMTILYVRDIGKEDEGEYTIAVTNITGGCVEKKLRFELPKEPPIVTLKMDKYQTYVVLIATVAAEWPIRNWIWKKDDVIINDRNWKFQENKPSIGERTLTITKLSDEDCGRYSCVAETVAGNGESEQIQLKEVTPEISFEMKIIRKEKKLRIFARAQPECQITSVKWFHNNHEIHFTSQSKYIQTIMPNSTSYVLGILDVSRTDEGEYRAVIKSKPWKTTTKTVFFDMSNDLAEASLSITQRDRGLLELTASVKSLWPVDAVRWQRDGKDITITTSDKYTVESIETNITKLKIKYPGQEDQGEYKVLVETVAGINESQSVFVEESRVNSIINVKQPTTTNFDKSKESFLNGIVRPYKAAVNCEICNKTATAVIQDCAHYFCLDCLQIAVGSIENSKLIIACPKWSCSSFINTGTFKKFINKQHTIHLEMPLHFQVSIGICMGRGCRNKGFIKIAFCHHSLCMTCLQKCKSLSSCVGDNCSNTGMPPTRYLDHLMASLKEKGETPFLLRTTDSPVESWTCSACGKSAVYEIIRCCHRFCENCIGKIIVSTETPVAVAKCQFYNCNELYPVPKDDSNPSPEVTPPSGTQESLGATCAPEEQRIKKENYSKDHAVTDDKYPPSSSSVSSTKGKWKGLPNIAFSCYRNCILQILAETPRFYECLEDTVKQESGSWSVRLREILCRIRNQNTAGLEMWSILDQFHHEFNNSNTGYREYEQEDSLSFLTTVLNGLDEEYEKSKIGINGKLRNPVEIFRGQFEDKYTCQNCKKEEYFNRSDFLSLPLLKKATLEASFIGFLEEEEIDVFPCTKCNSTLLQKQLHICSFPDALVLQINKHSESDGGRREKKIDFKESLKEVKNKGLLKKICYNDIKSYKLCGVVVHRGDERGGHYISYVKRRSQLEWEECDDSLTSPISVKNVLKVDAYILFYEKCESEV